MSLVIRCKTSKKNDIIMTMKIYSLHLLGRLLDGGGAGHGHIGGGAGHGHIGGGTSVVAFQAVSGCEQSLRSETGATSVDRESATHLTAGGTILGRKRRQCGCDSDFISDFLVGVGKIMCVEACPPGEVWGMFPEKSFEIYML